LNLEPKRRKGSVTIEVGQTAAFRRRYSQADFDRFAALSGDDNPIHVDPVFSARSRFGRTVAHGMLLYAAISRLLGTQLPGPGSLQLQQQLVFLHPTPAGTDISVQLEVLGVDPRADTAEIRTTIALPDGKSACEGRTLVRLPGGRGGFEVRCEPAWWQGRSEAASLGHLSVGQSASTRRAFTQGDLAAYAALTGDSNPLFLDPGYARRVGFDGCQVPGPLVSGLFSRLLGTDLPGRGTNWLKQRLCFLSAARVGDELTATVEIVRIRAEKSLVNLRGECRGASGKTVCRAESLVLVRDVAGTAVSGKR
jgi:acyl dehydratase